MYVPNNLLTEFISGFSLRVSFAISCRGSRRFIRSVSLEDWQASRPNTIRGVVVHHFQLRCQPLLLLSPEYPDPVGDRSQFLLPAPPHIAWLHVGFAVTSVGSPLSSVLEGATPHTIDTSSWLTHTFISLTLSPLLIPSLFLTPPFLITAFSSWRHRL